MNPNLKFVRVLADVYIGWSGEPPVYRSYVNGELFSERTYIWTDDYLEEAFQIFALPGQYQVHFELLPHPNAHIKVKNIRVDEGPGRMRKGELEIYS